MRKQKTKLKEKYMLTEYFARTQKNLLYILCGMIICLKLFRPELDFNGVEYIILFIGGICFGYEGYFQIKNIKEALI